MDTSSTSISSSKHSNDQDNRHFLNLFMLVDCSGSMADAGKIECINQLMIESISHLQAIEHEKDIKVDLNVIKFSSRADWHIHNASSINEIEWRRIEAGGITNTGAALHLVAHYLEENSDKYDPKNLPVIILITDGLPTDDYQSGLRALFDTKWGHKSVRYAISIGDDTDKRHLHDFRGISKGGVYQVDDCRKLSTQINKILKSLTKPISKGSQQSLKSAKEESTNPMILYSIEENKIEPKKPRSKIIDATRPLNSCDDEQLTVSIQSCLNSTTIDKKNAIDEEKSISGQHISCRISTRPLAPDRILVDWLEEMPYPLASIVWRYYAEIEDRSKIENLLHFFEATAQYVCMIFLSAFHSDKQYFMENRQQWFGDEISLNNPIKRSSFGTWVVIGERLAKSVRRLLSDPFLRQRCFQLFGTNRPDLLEALTHKELYSILKTVNDYRNNWQGHGGVASDEECFIRRDKLEIELMRLQKIITNKFNDYVLLRPINAEFQDEIFYNTVVNLMGTRSFFRKVLVQTKTPLDKRNLFIKDSNSFIPLKLIPLVKMESTPRKEQNACYFYNRIETKGIRWVSYHFGDISEITLEDQELLTFFKELEDQTADSTFKQ